MKVVVDNKIPYIKEAITRIADEVVFLPGDGFTKEFIKDAGCVDYDAQRTVLCAD